MIEIQLSLIVWTVICFFIMLFVLDKLLLKPMLRFMDDRQKRIESAEVKKQELSEAKKNIEDEIKRLTAEKTEKLRAEKELSEQQKAEEWEKMLVKRAELKLKNIADCKNELDIQKDRMMLEIDNRTETLAEEFVTEFLSMAEKI